MSIRETLEAAIAALPIGAYVATDADGTLWMGDTGDDAMRWIAAAVDPQVDVPAYLAREAVDYAGACRESALTLNRVGGATDAFEAFLADRLRPRSWLIEALREAGERGVEVVVVTAAPADAARHAARVMGLHDWPVLGIEVFDDELVEPAPVGPGKVAAWRAAGLPQPVIAIGDSVHDHPLLDSATRGFLVGPDD
jgi:phosphoserine phosphatase